MTTSFLLPPSPQGLLRINRVLVSRAQAAGHVDPAVAAAALLYVLQLERELAAGVIEPDHAVRQAAVISRAACTTHPDRTGGAP